MKAAAYRIVPDEASSDTLRIWNVYGGEADYVVKHSVYDDEWTCSCPSMCKSPAARRNLVRRNGCKHVHKVMCFTGDHKFMPTLAGPECVRCGMSEAEYDYETYGPPDRRDY